MPTITVKQPGGDLSITGEDGGSVMEMLRDAGVDGIIALCGGCCSCATCHVHVEDGTGGGLPPISETESELLDDSSERTALSRLSCQLPFDERAEGLVVSVPPT